MLRALIQHADYNTCECFPALRTIAGISGFSKPTVIDALRRLEEVGVITFLPTKGGAGNSNTYTLNITQNSKPPLPLNPPKTVNVLYGSGEKNGKDIEKKGKDIDENGKAALHELPYEPPCEPNARSRAREDEHSLQKEKTKNKENLAACFAAIGRQRRHPPPADEESPHD